MKTLVKFLVTAPLLLLPACNSDTSDLHKVSPPTLNSELQNFEPAQTNLKAESGELSIPVLPNIGPVYEVEVMSPGELKNVDPAKLKNVKQTISIKSDPQIPKLDLLFLVDDSNSMEPHQENYFGAMDQFHAELKNLDLLDYQIGVATIYDSSRYFKVGEPGSDRYERGVREFSMSERGKENFYRLGRLHPIQNTPKRFAVKSTDSVILSNALKVGAQRFAECDKYQDGYHADGCDEPENSVLLDPVQNITSILMEAAGPLKEEMLAPLIAAVHPAFLLVGSGADTAHFRAQYPRVAGRESESPNGNNDDAWLKFANSWNSGFVRPEAHLGVIVLTDVYDSSVGVNAEKAAEALKDLKGDTKDFEKITTYGVLHKNSVSFGLQQSDPAKWKVRNCTEDVDDAVRNSSGFDQPQMLEDFLNRTRGKKALGKNILNICSEDYGAALASVAKDLFKKSVSLGKYELEMFPGSSINVVYKSNPAQKVPVCGTTGSEDLCFKTTIKFPPEKSYILLYNRAELQNEELDVIYQGIDLSSCTNLNCNIKGQ